MSAFGLFQWALVTLFGGQGLLLTLFPQRVAAYQMAKYRRFGIQPAEPGPASFLYYRLAGAGSLAAAAFLLFQFVTE